MILLKLVMMWYDIHSIEYLLNMGGRVFLALSSACLGECRC